MDALRKKVLQGYRNNRLSPPCPYGITWQRNLLDVSVAHTVFIKKWPTDSDWDWSMGIEKTRIPLRVYS